MQGDEAHAPGGVAGIALGGHVRHDVGAVLDVGGLPEGGVRSAGVVVVPAQHHGADLAVSHHLVEFQGDVHASHGVLIQDAALGAHHHAVALGVPDPHIVVIVLIPPVVFQDIRRGGGVGLVQILRLSRQAAPPEGPVAEVEQARPQNVLHIGGEHESVQVVFAVAAHVPHSGVKHGLQEAVAVVEEIRPPVVEFADHLIMPPQGFVHQLPELLRVMVQQLRPLGEGQPLGAVSAVIGDVAGGLVAEQVHVHIVFVQVFQQVHHVAVIGDGAGGPVRQVPPGHGQRLLQAVGALADPPLGIPGLDAGVVHLRDNGHGPGDLRRLALGPAHAAQASRHKQPPGQVPIGGDPQLQPPGVEQGVEGPVDNALGPDIHPAACRHLAVVGHPQGGGAVEVLLVVKGPHHQAVGDDAPGRQLMAVEQPQGVAGHDHQGLLVRHDLQIFLDEPVLHPVLAHLPRLAVGHQLIGVQGHVEVQVVVHHHLEGLGLYAVAPILVNGLAVKRALRPEAISVDPAMLLQLPGKLPCHLQMMVRVDVPQGVADGQRLVCLGQMRLPPGGPADPLPEGGIWGQVVIQFHRHCVVNIIKCHKLPPVFVEYFLIIYYIQLRRICQFSKKK